jgi:hypothetical protein
MQSLGTHNDSKGLRKNVPDKMVQTIYRWGRYSRSSNRIFAWRLPFIESFGPQLRTGLRAFEYPFKNVMSKDGVLHKSISVSVKVLFDVHNAEDYLKPILAKSCEGVLRNRVRSIIEATLRNKVRKINSAELLSSEVVAEIEQAIRERLATDLEVFGVTLPDSEDALYIAEILPPDRIAETRAEARNIIETHNSLTQLPWVEIAQILKAHLYRDIGNQGVQFKVMNLPDSINPISDDDTVEGSYRVLRQPTGVLYSN